MKALVYRRSVPRYLLARLVSRVAPARFFAGLVPLSMDDMPFECPAGWITLKPLMCGVCGSDLALLRGAESFLLEPYSSFPFIIGHEVVAEVADAPAGSEWKQGDRVAVEPLLPCDVRGVERCSFCASGRYNLCENFTAGKLPPGIVTGLTRGAGGGAAELMACHPKQLVRLPAGMADERAVLVDSLASALQPVLDNFPDGKGAVVVYGCGIIGQHVVRLFRHLGCSCTVIAVARHKFQQDLAQAGGADQVLLSPDRPALAAAVGGRFLPTTLRGGNIEGGADMFFDCAGTTQSVQNGLLALRGRGRFVMVATAAEVGPLDLSSVWFRELTITGSASYSRARVNGEPVHTYSKAMEILGGNYKAENLLSHTFRLHDYADAFNTAFDKTSCRSMKVAFDMRTAGRKEP